MELGDLLFVFLALELRLGTRWLYFEVLRFAELSFFLPAHNFVIDFLRYHFSVLSAIRLASPEQSVRYV
jgi:hypothetical protein